MLAKHWQHSSSHTKAHCSEPAHDGENQRRTVGAADQTLPSFKVCGYDIMRLILCSLIESLIRWCCIQKSLVDSKEELNSQQGERVWPVECRKVVPLGGRLCSLSIFRSFLHRFPLLTIAIWHWAPLLTCCKILKNEPKKAPLHRDGGQQVIFLKGQSKQCMWGAHAPDCVSLHPDTFRPLFPHLTLRSCSRYSCVYSAGVHIPGSAHHPPPPLRAVKLNCPFHSRLQPLNFSLRLTWLASSPLTLLVLTFN